jgi:small subunit ribosomal protein S19
METEFIFKGKKLEELQKMDIKEFAKLIPSRERRTLIRGYTDAQKRLLKKIDKAIEGKYKKPIKTHCRDVIILPKMVNLTIHIHKGKSFEQVKIQPEMIGHYLGEFALTRQRIQHSAPGVGATKSSSAVSAR